MTSQHPPERPSTRRSAPVEPARKPVPVGHRRPAIARRSARLRPGVFGLVVALSTVAGWLFSSTSMVWLGSQLLFPDVAVTADVSLGNTDTVDLLEYRVSAGHSRGPPANVDEPRSTQHTYYVVAGTTPVLVHNCDFAPGKADEHFDKHVLGLDDAGQATRTPDMPEYNIKDLDKGFDNYVSDAKSLMCSDTCPAGAREAIRSDGVVIRMDSQGRVGMRNGSTITTFFRPDDPAAYFAREAAR